MSAIRSTWIVFLIILAGSLGAQEQDTAAPQPRPVDSSLLSNYVYPELVLTSGKRVPYVQYSISGNRVEVHTPTGEVRVFDRDQLDFEATVRTSRGQSRVNSHRSETPVKHHSDPKAGLAAVAGKTSLKLPDPNHAPEKLEVDLSKANVIEVKPQGAFPDETDSEDEAASETAGPEAVAGELADLRNARRCLASGLREVNSDCSGYTTGRNASCGKRGVLPRRFTAACQDAVTRARAEVAPVRDAFDRLRIRCRKAGMTPGELRNFIRDQGLTTLDAQIRATDAELDGLQGGSRD